MRRPHKTLRNVARTIMLATRRRSGQDGRIAVAARSNLAIAHVTGRPGATQRISARQRTTIRQGRGEASAQSETATFSEAGKGGEL